MIIFYELDTEFHNFVVDACPNTYIPSKLQYDTDTGRTFPLYDREYFREND